MPIGLGAAEEVRKNGARSEARSARLFSLLMQIILAVQRKKAPCYARKSSLLIPLT